MEIRPWIKAARLPSQSYIFLPLLLGQAIAMANGHDIGIISFLLVHGYGLAIQLFIVFANDYADQETDAHNSTYTPFSGGSRVLVDGDLHPHQLLKAAVLMAAACVVITIAAGSIAGTVWPPILAVAGILLLWLYSYGPMRVSYSGGGEVLQMLGVGCVLPLIGYSAQVGSLTYFPWELLRVILPTQLACAIGTAIPDYPSDNGDRKKTVPVLIGLLKAKRLVVFLHLCTIAQLFLPLPGAGTSEVPVALSLTALLSATIMLCFMQARPGTKGTLAFTFLSILATLASMAALTAAHWA